MEGRVHPGVKNHLREKWSLHQRVEMAESMTSLMEHPAWAVMDEIVAEAEISGQKSLTKLAHKAAMSTDPADRIEYAEKSGVNTGLMFHRDVVASVLDSAKTAAAELKKTAALDEAAERS